MLSLSHLPHYSISAPPGALCAPACFPARLLPAGAGVGLDSPSVPCFATRGCLIQNKITPSIPHLAHAPLWRPPCSNHGPRRLQDATHIRGMTFLGTKRGGEMLTASTNQVVRTGTWDGWLAGANDGERKGCGSGHPRHPSGPRGRTEQRGRRGFPTGGGKRTQKLCKIQLRQ